MLQLYRRLDRPIQLLLLNELTINLSFYMLYPFLAVYFSETLGLETWKVGFILGIRVLCQQGLTIIGGTLSDRIGPKPVITAGLGLRTIGFGMFGIFTSFEAVLVAAILSGLAGALFSPAARSYMAVEAAGQRAEVFALSSVASRIGMLAGPLLGLSLLAFSLPAVSLFAAAIFLVLNVLQARYLPSRQTHVADASETAWSYWREVFTNRAFVLFSVAMLGYLALFNQLYLGLPIEVERLTGGQAGAGFLFTLSAVLTILLQVPFTSFCRRHWSIENCLAGGLALMGIAFVPPLVTQGLLPVSGSGIDDVVNLLPVLVTGILLTLGLMIINPFSHEMVPVLARERLIGTYFGAFSMAGASGTTALNSITGVAFDTAEDIGFAGLPWLIMVAVGLCSSLGLYVINQAGLLKAAEPDRSTAG